MENLKAEHLGSGREAKHWPKATLPEYAFIGRSNVGKSSLINMLVGIHRLARVSNTPGRTRNVEHFRVEAYKGKGQAWMLADLPGYGFAKASKDERALWEVMIRTYLRERESLQCVFVLVDVRIAPQQSDLDMIQWLGGESIPFVIVFTKSDKLKQPSIVSNIAQFKRALKKNWETLPHLIITSSENGKGRDEVLAFITDVNSRWGS
ncbi:MAG: ribosome biogenesis GTP-binding protein YihA/YsxC [Flavobacteriales bacterium]|jgi:GTP-binding protein|nr:YihA family ribosome biogenesis GTP-binding protein [Flavobacteriales bacterium]MCI1751407.1 ribosome biogenesis GTP-binding protein YihA/YsxC [Flavobacteriales bacterium]